MNASMWVHCKHLPMDQQPAGYCGGVEFRRSTIPPWIFTVMNGCVDNRSGFGEEDDSDTGEVGGRELVLVFSVL